MIHKDKSVLKEDIYEALFKNATVFLNCAVSYMNKGLSNYGNKVLTIVNLQMALELATKAIIVKHYGLANILHGSDFNMADDELERMYNQNRLKVKEFEQLKNFLKSKRIIDFDKSEYLYMERFQLYRNRFVHLNYKFSEDEENQLEKDIIHVLVYILGVLMSEEVDLENRTFMQDYINMDEYKKLVENPQYFTALSDLISSEYGDPYHCPMCSKKLLTPDKKCLGCLLDFNDNYCYGYVECCHCHEDMVIYDKLNIELNNNVMRGLCLCCLEYTEVYECPVCESAVNLNNCDESCRPGYCEWE